MRSCAIIVAGAMWLSGCGWFGGNDNNVPVTKPTHVTSLPTTQPAGPAVAPLGEVAAQPAPAAPAPATRPATPAKVEPGLSPALPAGPSVGPAGPAIAPLAEPASQPASPPVPVRPASPPTPPAAATQPAGELVSVSALQINDKFVTVNDILRITHRELSEVPKNISEQTFRARAAEIITDAIRGRITQLLVLREAQKRITEDKTKEVDKELDDLRKEWVNEIGKGSVQKLEAVLKGEGTSLKELMDDERNRLISQAYLREKFIASIFVNHRMILDYFRKHQAEFSSDKQVQMQIIAAPVSAFLETQSAGEPSRQEVALARTRAKAVIEQAAAALKAAQDFGETARKLSKGLKAEQGGLWPMMSAGSFKESKVEDAAFAMEKGQVSDVLDTATGFYIVKVADLKPPKAARFEDVQEQIESTLRQEQYRKLTDSYLQEMVKHATIVHNEEFARLTIDRAVARHWRKTPEPAAGSTGR